MFIEGHVHRVLMHHGGWVRLKYIAAHLVVAERSVADALGRLRRRGAALRKGNTSASRWMGVAMEVIDKREFNGRHVNSHNLPRPKQSHSVELKPTALAQALAWEPVLPRNLKRRQIQVDTAADTRVNNSGTLRPKEAA